jgi:hypothetical protein
MKFWLFILIAISGVSAACSSGTTNGNTVTNTAAPGTSPAANGATAPSNSTATTGYPQDTVDAFLKSCQGAGSTPAFCTCVLKKVEAKYTFEEFKTIEGEIADGSPSKEFIAFTEKARTDCLK